MNTTIPSEVIDLPSKGHFYTKDNPLSSGTIEIKYPTAAEENILTSTNLIRKGIVIDKLIEAVVLDKTIDLDTMLLGDKNAITYAVRILGYGSTYSTKITCPTCNEKQVEDIDLNVLAHKELDFDEYPEEINEFSFTLPYSKLPIKHKFLTQKDEKEISRRLKGLKKIGQKGGDVVDSEITTRLKQLILEVDGDSSQARINEFVDKELLSRDSFALRTHLVEITPDLDTRIRFICYECGAEETIDIPLDVSFFWPSGRL